MKIEKVFGRLLGELRKERGLSQEELGFESGYHRTYISFLERGIKCPSLNTVFKLTAALKISPSEMIRRVETRLQTAADGYQPGRRNTR